jgi:hypothetical protein
MTPQDFLDRRNLLHTRIELGRLHPEAAARQFSDYALQIMASAPPEWERHRLVWMAETAVAFERWCRARAKQASPHWRITENGVD